MTEVVEQTQLIQRKMLGETIPFNTFVDMQIDYRDVGNNLAQHEALYNDFTYLKMIPYADSTRLHNAADAYVNLINSNYDYSLAINGGD